MRNYKTDLDAGALYDGDGALRGVDERNSPELVQPGLVSKAVNYEFRDGRARPRKGCVALPWSNRVGMRFPIVFPINFFNVVPFDVVYGAGVFQDPDDREWIIAAADGKIWRLREGQTAKEVPVPAGENVAVECTFTQCMDRLILFRGESLAELEMSDVLEGFKTITQRPSDVSNGKYNPEGAEDNTAPIPNAANGLYLQNRLFVPHDRDLVGASDYLNYTRFVPILEDFRVNQGSEDKLVRLFKYGEDTIACFKESSIYLARNVTGDLSGLVLEELTKGYGLLGQKAVAPAGADVWFLSQRGVTSIAQTDQNKVQGTNVIWSDPIEPTIRRINWRYVGGACATFFEGRFYLAVPLDDAVLETGGNTYTGVNNAVLVYDTVNQAWWGTHTGKAVCVKDWVQFKWHRRLRLGFVSADGYLRLYGECFDDTIRPSEADGTALAEIETELLTRGYTCDRDADWRIISAGQGKQKRFRGVTLNLGTWDPSFSVEIVTDGVNESRTLASGETRNRRKYIYPAWAKRWDESNVNDDHGKEGREDYSILLPSSDADADGVSMDPGSGVDIEALQVFRRRFGRMNTGGLYAQVRLTNTRGRCELGAVNMDAVQGTERGGVTAA